MLRQRNDFTRYLKELHSKTMATLSLLPPLLYLFAFINSRVYLILVDSHRHRQRVRFYIFWHAMLFGSCESGQFFPQRQDLSATILHTWNVVLSALKVYESIFSLMACGGKQKPKTVEDL